MLRGSKPLNLRLVDLAFLIDWVMQIYLVDFQEITPPQRLMTYPLVDFNYLNQDPIGIIIPF